MTNRGRPELQDAHQINLASINCLHKAHLIILSIKSIKISNVPSWVCNIWQRKFLFLIISYQGQQFINFWENGIRLNFNEIYPLRIREERKIQCNGRWIWALFYYFLIAAFSDICIWNFNFRDYTNCKFYYICRFFFAIWSLESLSTSFLIIT